MSSLKTDYFLEVFEVEGNFSDFSFLLKPKLLKVLTYYKL